MKLKEYKLRKKEDYAIFKSFLRCMKEHGLYKRFDGYNDMIRRCYSSRDNHRVESFLTNISFWLGDTGSGISRQEIRILYMSLIINSLPMEYFSTKKTGGGIIDNMKNMVKNSTLINPSSFVVKDDYYDIVCSALTKCFGMSDNDDSENVFSLIIKGKEMGIPF